MWTLTSGLLIIVEYAGQKVKDQGQQMTFTFQSILWSLIYKYESEIRNACTS